MTDREIRKDQAESTVHKRTTDRKKRGKEHRTMLSIASCLGFKGPLTSVSWKNEEELDLGGSLPKSGSITAEGVAVGVGGGAADVAPDADVAPAADEVAALAGLGEAAGEEEGLADPLDSENVAETSTGDALDAGEEAVAEAEDEGGGGKGIPPKGEDPAPPIPPKGDAPPNGGAPPKGDGPPPGAPPAFMASIICLIIACCTHQALKRNQTQQPETERQSNTTARECTAGQTPTGRD